MSAKTPDSVMIEFLERVTEGRSGRDVCKDKDMPGWSSVWRRVCSDAEFAENYRVAMQSRGMIYADKLDEMDRLLLSGQITESAHRTICDNIKWRSSKLVPKVYGDRQQVDVKHEAGGSYLELLQQVNKAAQLRHVDVVESKENTQAEALRAREINHISVNKDMPKKKANRQKKGKKLSTGS